VYAYLVERDNRAAAESISPQGSQAAPGPLSGTKVGSQSGLEPPRMMERRCDLDALG